MRRSQRGITTVELSLAGALLCIVGGGFLFLFSSRSDHQARDTAHSDAQRIHAAAESWRAENPEGCPTLSVLSHDGKLDDDAATDDPWGGRFRLNCSDDELVVSSAGEDGKLGTADDVRVPKAEPGRDQS